MIRAKDGWMPFDDGHIEDAFSRTGYPLEQRIEAACAEMGMVTTANVPMLDPATGKARETDLTARWVEARGSDQIWTRPGIGANLLIECVRSETPFLFYQKPTTYTECGDLPTLFGFPLYLEDPPGSSGFSRLEDKAEASWWATLTTIATQWHGFESKRDKQPRLVASQRHDIHGTFEKLVRRAEAVADESMKPGLIKTAFLGGWLIFIRPVLVVEGTLQASVLEAGTQRREERHHVHYLRTSLLANRHVAWLIDVVTESEFRAYLGRLKESMARLERFCLAHAPWVQAALKSDAAQHLCIMLRPNAR